MNYPTKSYALKSHMETMEEAKVDIFIFLPYSVGFVDDKQP